MTDVFSLEERELATWLEERDHAIGHVHFHWELLARDLLKKQKEEIIGIIQKISDRLKMDSDELKMKKTSYDWNNGIITFREQLKSHFLDSEFFVCKGALKNEALAENDNGSDIFARITPVTANKSKSDLGETSDISASVATPEVVSKTFICTQCRHKFTLDIQWMIDEIVKEKHAKICLKCQNEMIREAVYGSKEQSCLNCGVGK